MNIFYNPILSLHLWEKISKEDIFSFFQKFHFF